MCSKSDYWNRINKKHETMKGYNFGRKLELLRQLDEVKCDLRDFGDSKSVFAYLTNKQFILEDILKQFEKIKLE